MTGVLPYVSDYPYAAGYKEETTSLENAERIEASGRAETLRALALDFFNKGGQATADELAEIMGHPFRAIQPRVSELKARGLIKPTGIRRTGSGGGTCHVWCKA